MTAFLVHEPRCVFIHNPKTGGMTIRSWLLKEGCFEGPVNGPLPESWMGEFKFAFVRNPFDRLVSAWKMFTEGVHNSDWRLPPTARPDMTLREFLDIVLDESIGFGPDRNYERRIRNHTLPQVHPYYAIDKADFVGRFEQYEQGLETICRELHVDPIRPKRTHLTRRQPYPTYYDAETRQLATKYYAEDLARFGYQFDPDAA